MADLATEESTEAIADAIVDVLADPNATRIHDQLERILEMAETVREMEELCGDSHGMATNRTLSDSCDEAARDVIESRLDDMETEAYHVAGRILSALGNIELRRDLV